MFITASGIMANFTVTFENNDTKTDSPESGTMTAKKVSLTYGDQ